MEPIMNELHDVGMSVDPATAAAAAAELAADARRSLRVFLAAPSLRLTGPADGVFTLALRGRVTALREALLDAGVTVYSQHHDDCWTTRGLGTGYRVPSAFRGMQSADLAFAYIGSPLSAGVGMELGWATALRKPVVLLVDETVAHSPMISTLEEVSPVLPIHFDTGWNAQALRHAVITALDWADTSVIYPESAESA
jgi:nucleoside 2-deoxyribosyltransferase